MLWPTLLRRQRHGAPPLEAGWALPPERVIDGEPLASVGASATQAALPLRWCEEATSIEELLALRIIHLDEASQPHIISSFWRALGHLARSPAQQKWIAAHRTDLADALVTDLDVVIDGMSPRELTGVAIGLSGAQLANRSPFSSLFSRLAVAAASMPDAFRDGELILLIDVASRAGRTGPQMSTLTAEMALRIAEQPGRITPAGLHGLLRSCSRVSFRSVALLDAIESELGRTEVLDCLNMPQLVDTAWSLAVANHGGNLFQPSAASIEEGGGGCHEEAPTCLAAYLGRALAPMQEHARQAVDSGRLGAMGGGVGGESRSGLDLDEPAEANEVIIGRHLIGGLARNHLAQLHEFWLWLCVERHRRSGAVDERLASLMGLPAESPLRGLCRAAFIEEQLAVTARAQPGSLVRTEHALRDLGYTPRQVVTAHGMVLPLVIEHSGVDVAVQVEPPFGFHEGLTRSVARLLKIRGAAHRPPAKRGWLTLRQRQLRWLAAHAGGPQLLAVPFWELHPAFTSPIPRQVTPADAAGGGGTEAAAGGAARATHVHFAAIQRLPWEDQPPEVRTALSGFFKARLAELLDVRAAAGGARSRPAAAARPGRGRGGGSRHAPPPRGLDRRGTRRSGARLRE